MAKVPKLSQAAARRHWRGGALGVLLLGAVPACMPPIPDPAPATIKHAVLICADSDHDVFAELKSRFTRLEVTNMAESPECTRGKLAAGEVGYTCFDDEPSCTTPHFVDGKPIETPGSAYDLVLLFPQLLHGSLSAKTVSTTKTVTVGDPAGAVSATAAANSSTSAGAGAAATTGSGAQRRVAGGRASRPAPGQTQVTETALVSTPEIDYTGEVLVFEPRPGKLHPGKRFKDLGADPLRDRLLELLRR